LPVYDGGNLANRLKARHTYACCNTGEENLFSGDQHKMFKFKTILVLALAVCASSAWAQLMPKSELTGGYTYTSLDEGAAGRVGGNVFHEPVAGL
jgi:hypothetical protein